jgi:hypothetical protein
VINYTEY